ncbi:carbon storage regulator [Stieleria sp. TO1_6]|uniref:carbon storage regulator n=1 Tax=Stieleria tagensis TaxID=2956795 RepID=UPI00209A9928|nr:carbon storage regulator [Stieleria tagensis]MCO8125283.1 carbon storage regulator [Stieleria tagensis]
MLVLTRRVQDRVVFPELGITIEILKTSGTRTQLGIVAPPTIRVVRHELHQQHPSPAADSLAAIMRDQFTSEIRHEIESAGNKLAKAQQQLAAGNTDDALLALSESIAELGAIRKARSFGSSCNWNDQPDCDSTTVAESIAEPASQYTVSVPENSTEQPVSIATDQVLAALYQLLGDQKPDALVITLGQ